MRFQSTSWTMVTAAAEYGQDEAPRSEEALTRLLETYTPAVHLYLVSRFRFSKGDADDLIQGFILDKVLTKKLLGRASKEKGKFRTFLLTAMNRYVVDYLRARGAKKRIPPEMLTSSHDADIELQGLEAPAVADFDLAFIRQVLAMAIQRCHAHCGQRGMNDVWLVFSNRILKPVFDDSRPTSFDQLTEELQLESVDQTRNRLVSAKRIFKRELRAVILDYSESDEDILGELAMFQKLLGVCS